MQGPEKRITPALTVSQALEQALAHHDRGNLAEAERLYAAILGVDAEDADALHLLGVLRKQQRRYDEAIRLIGAALERDPEYVEAHVNLGLTLGDVRRHDEAIDSYRKALAIDSGCAAAHYNMGLALAARGRREEAVASYRGALAANPGYLEAHFNLAIALHGLRRRDEAVASLRRTLEIKPDYARAHFTLGVILQEAGRLAEAEASYRGALAIQPDHSEAHGCLGLALQGQGRMAEAEASYRQALAFHPDNADLHNNLGVTLKEQGRYDEAGESFRRALAIMPQYAEVHGNLGSALHGQGRLAEAEASHRRALTIKPDHALGHVDLGNTLRRLCRFTEADASYQRALAINPELAEAHINLGASLADQGRFDEAEESQRRALAIRPDYAEAYSDLACVMRERHRLAEAEACCRRALAIRPDHAGALNILGTVLSELGNLTEAEASYRRALALAPGLSEAHSNLLFMLNYRSTLSRAQLLEEHLAWARRHETPHLGRARPHANRPAPQRRLRVGYVSPDFRRHSVAYFIEPILERHDRLAFEVYCYSNVLRPDETTRRLLALADRAFSIAGMSDLDAAGQVRADGVDILVDLAGHTGRGRLGVFAARVAPVQVAYLGYPNTTGLAAVDWRLTDVHADPLGDGDHYYTERLARMPATFLCFRPPREAPQVEPPPFLGKGYITFGSFNARQKVTTEVVQTWARLLERVPRSRLMLKGAGFGDATSRAGLLEEFARSRIAAERVILLPRDAALGTHLAHYHEVDIGLDTFPYNGTTTTLEALWMGVPVVSLAGDRHAARVGSSILTNLGLRDLVAGSAADYIELGGGLAADADRLAALRHGLRERVAASPLADEVGFTRSVERAYREMWRRWCVGAAPERLDVASGDDSPD